MENRKINSTNSKQTKGEAFAGSLPSSGGGGGG